MEKPEDSPLETWTESMVSIWLRSIGIKETYIEKLHEEEVDGPILRVLSEENLKKETGMKSGPALLIIKKRDELVNNSQKSQRQHDNLQKQSSGQNDHGASAIKSVDTRADVNEQTSKEDSVLVVTTKRDSKPRPFNMMGIDFAYVENSVLLPESGVSNFITPCHEYKSFAIAATLNRHRLQAKFAKEVLRFATGCMNVRTNGTIHFGVMDSRGGTGYVHGEIIGVPVEEKDVYYDSLDYIERSFSSSDSEIVRLCIGEPQFVKVVGSNSNVEHYVVEVDIKPVVSIVKNKVFSVSLPNFNEKANKVQFGKKNAYRRVGSKTEQVADLIEFHQQINFRDAQREEAEKMDNFTAPIDHPSPGRPFQMKTPHILVVPDASIHPKEGITLTIETAPNFLKIKTRLENDFQMTLIREEEDRNTVWTATIEKDELDLIRTKKDQPCLNSEEAKARYFDNHWPDLIQNVTNVQIIADKLCQKKLIHKEKYSEITNRSSNIQESMREICHIISKYKDPWKAEFISILQKEKLYDF